VAPSCHEGSHRRLHGCDLLRCHALILGQRARALSHHQGPAPDRLPGRSRQAGHHHGNGVGRISSMFLHAQRDEDHGTRPQVALLSEVGRTQQAATFPLAQRSRRCSEAMKWNVVAQPLRAASPSSHVTPNATTTGCPSDISIGDLHVGRPLDVMVSRDASVQPAPA